MVANAEAQPMGIDTELWDEIVCLMPSALQLSEAQKRFSYSANQVFSAVIKSAEVVIKPFKGFDKDKAEHEARMLEIVKSCGVSTLRPTTLCMGSLANYLMTRYEPDIVPLDQLGLSSLHSQKIQKIAADIGGVLSALHGNGIVHGDFRLKNLFMSPNEEVGAMDFERSEVYDDPDDSGYISGCHYDIQTILGSLYREIGDANLRDYEQPLIVSYQGAA